VALKVMHPHLARDARLRRQFLRAARAAATVPHDHLVPVFEVGQHDAVPYLAMPFLNGMTLEGWLAEGAEPTLVQVLRIGTEIAAGLDAIHRERLVHGDLKANNVWLEAPYGQVKILDMGLTRQTFAGARFPQPSAARNDLFGLGVILYRLCCGQVPFQGNSALSLQETLAHHSRPFPDLNVDVLLPLTTLIDQLLTFGPEDQPPSAQAVHSTLEMLLHDFRCVPDADVGWTCVR
jgi:serine/threonine protein kinase